MALLGLEQGFTPEDLKRAYRRAAHNSHPDKGGNAERFKQVKDAYEFLKSYQMSNDQKMRPTGPSIDFHSGGFTVTYHF